MDETDRCDEQKVVDQTSEHLRRIQRSGKMRGEGSGGAHAVRRIGESEVFALHVGVKETAEESGDNTALRDAFGLPVE